MHDEGYIKYQCYLHKTETIIPETTFKKINDIRTLLWVKKLIGSYADGVGYGNISIRDEDHPEKFFITGSATGHLQHTEPDSWSRVDLWNLTTNTLWCSGPLNASSESMSHAVIYQNLPAVNCVIHIHDKNLWLKGLKTLPSTCATAEYGTPEMAKSILDLIHKHGMVHGGLFVMQGHEEGMMAFGTTPGEALDTLLIWV